MAEKYTPEEIKEDIKDVSDIALLADTKGGKKLIDSIMTDVVSSVQKMSERSGTMTQQEFVAECSFIKANLDLVRAISRAKSTKEYLEGLLAEALKQ